MGVSIISNHIKTDIMESKDTDKRFVNTLVKALDFRFWYLAYADIFFLF